MAPAPADPRRAPDERGSRFGRATAVPPRTPLDEPDGDDTLDPPDPLDPELAGALEPPPRGAALLPDDEAPDVGLRSS